MDVFSPNPDMAALKEEILATGYNGEKVVFLGAADVPRITAVCQVGANMLTRLGMNVEYQSLDWGTIVQRGFRQNPISEGGWSMFGSMTGGLDWDNPRGIAFGIPLTRGSVLARFGWLGFYLRHAITGGRVGPVCRLL
jgi:peptide/nickel transport system substrate-binding protein